MNALTRIPWNFYGVWVLPLCGLMGVAVHGTLTYGWPVLFPVIVKEFGWSAAVAATASSLARFEGGIEGPIAGWVMDKYGPRVTFLFGGIVMALGFISMYWMTADNVLFYFIFFGVVVQTGFNVGGYGSSYKAVQNWWIKWRARATAAFVLPVGFAGTISPMIVAGLIVSVGWRTTLVYMGIFCLVIFIPCGLLIRPHKPEYYGLLPDGVDPKTVTADDAATAEKKARELALLQESAKIQADYSVKDAMKTNAFWVYTLASIFYNFGFGGVTLFIPAHMVSRGFDLPTAAFFAGMMLTFSYLGRLTVFFIGDAVSPKWLSIFSWVLSAIGVLCMANVTPETSYLAWGYAFVFGWGYGISFTIVPVVRGWLFGRAAFGTISGIMTTLAMIGSVIVPTVQGWTYDTYGSYWLGYTLLGAAYLIACVIFAFARKPAPKTTTVPAPSTA